MMEIMCNDAQYSTELLTSFSPPGMCDLQVHVILLSLYISMFPGRFCVMYPSQKLQDLCPECSFNHEGIVLQCVICQHTY